MNKAIFTACICIALNSICIGAAFAAGTQFTPFYLPAQTSQTSAIGCEHSNVGEHKLFCAKNKSACYDKNRSFRPHELTHCKIQYDQCMRAWD